MLVWREWCGVKFAFFREVLEKPACQAAHYYAGSGYALGKNNLLISGRGAFWFYDNDEGFCWSEGFVVSYMGGALLSKFAGRSR
ncbi:hypothetical protein [Bartonella acomydis]|uniref:hypothetical protein n=1 Tax=Bartonella acomydis TaxID=686234 RepID=UPI0031E8FEC1